jgi:hypothetical protein
MRKQAVPLISAFQRLIDLLAEPAHIRILSWRHSGFHVHCGPGILSKDDKAMENIAGYIIPASFTRGLEAPT